jgi:hypothetical protein
MIPVFSNGRWISYSPPSDVFWSRNWNLQAASLYAAALQKGYSEKEAAQLAEMYVSKQLYTGLQYSKRFEDQLKALLV